MLDEETKRHLPNVRPYTKRPPFLFLPWKPVTSRSWDFQESSQGGQRNIFAKVQEKHPPISQPDLRLALSILSNPALRVPSNAQSLLDPDRPHGPQGTDRWPEREQVISVSHKETAKVFLLIHWPSPHSLQGPIRESRSGCG